MSTELEQFVTTTLYSTYAGKCLDAGTEVASISELMDAVKIAAHNISKMVDDVGMKVQPYIAVRIDDTFSCIIQANQHNDTGSFGIVETAIITKILALEKEGDTNVGIHEDQTEHEQ